MKKQTKKVLIKVDSKASKPKKETKKILDEIEDLEETDQDIKKDLDKIIGVLEATGIRDFVRHLRSPWRIVWTNFVAGMARGLGIVIGMTVVVGISVWLLSHFVNFPLIGQFFQDFLDFLDKTSPPPSAG